MNQCAAGVPCKRSYEHLSTEELLESALQEKEALLQRKPGLRAYQKEIDRLVASAGSFENRLAVLSMMIEVKFEELRTQIAYLVVLTRYLNGYCALH